MSGEALDFPYRTGRIARAHGLKGDVLVQFFRRREHAADPKKCKMLKLRHPLLAELEFQDESLERVEVTHIRWLDPIRAVLRLSECQDRDTAEQLVGAYFDVDPERLALELHDDVDACFEARAIDADSGRSLGEVIRITDNGAQALLELEMSEGETALIPVVGELVVKVGRDNNGRFVHIRPLPGLLEANRR